MKYYAVTDDPRELYHYGVKGMKWGQHIFGDKPKSSSYHKAAAKLKKLSASAKKATTSSIKSLGSAVQKSVQQASYNRRAAQEKRFNKAVERSQKRFDKIDAKIDNYYSNVKPAREARKQAIVSGVRRAGQFARSIPGQIAYNVRRHEQQQYQKAVERSQQRNRLSDALRSLDSENKFQKQVDRDRKMSELREKQAERIADNDLKAMRKAVRAEKNMPKYMQEARTGLLKYGKLSDEQIGRVQNRLAIESNARRLGGQEMPSWRERKKLARREGYLQGITRGTAAAMEEVAKAGVQYGIKNLSNRKKLDNASEQRAKREKTAKRIKETKTHSEMREDLKEKTYQTQLEAGVNMFKRNPLTTAARTAKKLNAAEDVKRSRQNKIEDANEERRFLREENQNRIRNENSNRARLDAANKEADEIGKSLSENGYALLPTYNKDGKKTGMKVLTSNEGDGKAYLTLYRASHKIEADTARKQQEQEKQRREQEQREQEREQKQQEQDNMFNSYYRSLNAQSKERAQQKTQAVKPAPTTAITTTGKSGSSARNKAINRYSTGYISNKNNTKEIPRDIQESAMDSFAKQYRRDIDERKKQPIVNTPKARVYSIKRSRKTKG